MRWKLVEDGRLGGGGGRARAPVPVAMDGVEVVQLELVAAAGPPFPERSRVVALARRRCESARVGVVDDERLYCLDVELCVLVEDPELLDVVERHCFVRY